MTSYPPSTAISTSPSYIQSVFNSALDIYKEQTGHDLVLNPLLHHLQSCHSINDILSVLREQIPISSPSQSRDERFSNWLIPIVNVLFAFSASLGEGISLVFPPSKVIFAGICVLFLAVKDARASRDNLVNLFDRIGYFFHRLEIYTGVPPTPSMTDLIVEIMLEVLTILAIATKETKRGRFGRYLKNLMGNTDIVDALQKLDRLTQEEAHMASVELLKATHVIKLKVSEADEKVKGVDERVQKISAGLEDISNKVQATDDRVKDVGRNVEDMTNEMRCINDTIQGVDDTLDKVNRNRLRDDLLQWLSPPDTSTNHNIASKVRHNGTTEWFLRGNVYNQWKSTGSFLWIHGKAGSGKSIVCSSVIQDIMTSHEAGKVSIAYFYFDFRDVNKQKLQNLLPSLLIQLAAQSDPCCDVLSKLYYAHNRGVKKPSDLAMIKCFKEMLTRYAQIPTYIIMDALDECPTTGIPSPREEVLDFVDELVGLHLSNLRICVTSRLELDIQAVLETLTPHPISLHDEIGQKQDISKYVDSIVHSDRRMRRWREEDKDLVISSLSERADGMFRWVFCQLEVLRKCFPSSLRLILEELPDGLDETYEHILKNIRRANQGYAHRLLQCLVAAIRPLQVKELAEVLAFDFNAEGIPRLNPGWRWEDQEEAVMSACSGLVVVVKDGDSRIVQFSHFSVKEFLMSQRLAERSRDVARYHIMLEDAHTILAQASLGVLLRLDGRVDRDSIQSFPLAQYAARYWVEHARFKNVSSRVNDGMERLFDAAKPHFSTWLWIYDEDSRKTMTTRRPQKPNAVPLYYAARLGFPDLSEYLLTKRPEHVYARGGREVTPLHASIRAGKPDIFFMLIRYFPHLDIRGKYGQTLLHRASRMGPLEIGQWLLRHGANVNARDVDGWTPLHNAVMDGRFEFAQMLLEHHANVNGMNDECETPLYVASSGHVEVVRLLLEHGADINACDRFGWTPLHVASGGHAQVVRSLLEHGANIDARAIHGETPLHLASYGQTEVVRVLLEYGADVSVRDHGDSTALERASMGGWKEIVQLLSHYGDSVIPAHPTQPSTTQSTLS